MNEVFNHVGATRVVGLGGSVEVLFCEGATAPYAPPGLTKVSVVMQVTSDERFSDEKRCRGRSSIE